jgi:hypothetical protein
MYSAEYQVRVEDSNSDVVAKGAVALVVLLRVEQLLDVEDAECNVAQVHLHVDDHDLGKTPSTPAAEHMKRLMDVHLRLLRHILKVQNLRVIVPVSRYELT